MCYKSGNTNEECVANLVKIEHQVELADVSKIPIKHLHKAVDALQVRQFVVRHVNAECEEQAGVSSVDDLVCAELQMEGRHDNVQVQ
jgi:hypothetical protein